MRLKLDYRCDRHGNRGCDVWLGERHLGRLLFTEAEWVELTGEGAQSREGSVAVKAEVVVQQVRDNGKRPVKQVWRG